MKGATSAAAVAANLGPGGPEDRARRPSRHRGAAGADYPIGGSTGHWLSTSGPFSDT